MVGALNKLPVAASGILFFGDPATFANVSSILVGFFAGLVVRQRSLLPWLAILSLTNIHPTVLRRQNRPVCCCQTSVQCLTYWYG